MKKLFVLILISVLMICSLSLAQVKMYVDATIDAENKFTDSISPTYKSSSGRLNVTLYDADSNWVGTITLQRYYARGDLSKNVWLDVAGYSGETERYIIEREPGVSYRIGCKTGDYTSGDIVVRLSK